MGDRSHRRKVQPWRELNLEILENRDLLSVSPVAAPLPDQIEYPAPGAGAEVVIQSAAGIPDTKTGFLAKMDSTLASVLGQFQGQAARALSYPLAPNHARALVSDGSILVDAVAAGDTQLLRDDLLALGMTQSTTFGSIVSGWLPLDALDDMAVLDSLQFSSAAWQPWTNVGAVTSQGDQALRSDEARAAFGVDGSGVKVGVLSDSFNKASGSSYAQDRAAGDLPPGVQVLADYAGGRDEGRAMMQLVYDVAPGVELAFHTAFNGLADFANGIIELADAGADVIVDDIIYFGQPMFQDGIVAQAVDRVVSRGVAYFSSAGNAARNSYQATFVDSGQDVRVDGTPAGVLHDFDPGPEVDVRQRMTVPAGSGFVMAFQWDEPFFSVSGVGSRSDLDIYLVANGRAVAYSTTANVGGDPVEILSFFNTGLTPATYGTEFDLLISLNGGPAPTLMKTIRYDGGDGITVNEYDTAASTVYGHANAQGAEAVGAAFYARTPEFGVVPPALEPFSSAGGTPILFDVQGNRLTQPLRTKPGIVAPDGTNTSFFSVDTPQDADSWPNFFGTSAAAPHAAAVAALMLDRNPGLAPAALYQILRETAVDMGPDGFDVDSGHGLVDALAAVAAVPPWNGAPRITSIPLVGASVASPYVYQVLASDPNPGDILSFRLDVAPAGMTVDADTGLIEWMPTSDQSGPHAVTVRVVDQAGAFDTQSYTVTVVAEDETSLLGESGTVTVSQLNASSWQSVAFTRSYRDPVVVMGPPSYNGGHPSTARVRNVTSTGFQFQIDEWDYLDGGHTTETIGYLVVEAGRHMLEDGTQLMAGELSATHDWQSVELPNLVGTPVVLAQVTSRAEPSAVTTRLRNVTGTGFEVRLQEEEANDGYHAAETVSYVAVQTAIGVTAGLPFQVGLTSDSVQHTVTTVTFSQAFDAPPVFLANLQTADGGDPAALRYRSLSKTGGTVFIEEDQSQDSEQNHTTEAAGYFALQAGLIGAPAAGTNTVPQPPSLPVGESGSVTVTQANASTWQTVSFARHYADPVVVMGPISFRGEHPATVRVRGVTPTGFQFQVDEWDYLDGGHTAETVGYLVVDAGTHTLAAGTRLAAGTTTASHAWRNVVLPDLAGTPVVLSQVTSRVEASAVTTRLRDVTGSGFRLRVQEQQAGNGRHAAEQVSYVAVEAAAGVTGGVKFRSGLTPNNVRHTPANVTFGQSFETPPVFLANIQTTDGGDPAALRYLSLARKRATIFVEEERSRDNETNHTTEVVGYFALQRGLLDAPAAGATTSAVTAGAVRSPEVFYCASFSGPLPIAQRQSSPVRQPPPCHTLKADSATVPELPHGYGNPSYFQDSSASQRLRAAWERVSAIDDDLFELLAEALGWSQK
jgi:hypothetical protein